MKEFIKINRKGLAELRLDTSLLQIVGSDNNIDEPAEVTYTDFTFSINMNQVYKQAFTMCLSDERCMGDFDTENKIQLALYKGIAADATLSNDQKEDKHEKIYNATWNETSSDDLYEGYHEFFTKTKSATAANKYTITDAAGAVHEIKAGFPSAVQSDSVTTVTPVYVTQASFNIYK